MQKRFINKIVFLIAGVIIFISMLCCCDGYTINKGKADKKNVSNVKSVKLRTTSDNVNSPDVSIAPTKEIKTDEEKKDTVKPSTVKPSILQSMVPSPITQTKKNFGTATFVSAIMISNNHVGNEWSYSVKVNGKVLNELGSISLVGNDSLSIEVVEHDSIPDIGSLNTTINKNTKNVDVNVIENRGRYSGNSATWRFTFNVN
jgi:hypothetical protein